MSISKSFIVLTLFTSLSLILTCHSQTCTMQALLKSIIEKEKSRVVYLNCGLTDVSSPELMAMELRDQARNLPSQLDMRVIKLLASQLDPLSKLYTMFYADKEKKITSAATSAEAVFKAFFEDFFPEDKATDLRAVIRTYEFLLQNIPPGEKKPVIVIGALLQH